MLDGSLGDIDIAVKRVIFFSRPHLAIATVGLELALPTGRSSRGLGEGELVWEPNIRAGWEWRHQIVLQGEVSIELPQRTANSNAALLYDVAVGRYFAPDPRLQIRPLVELNTETALNGLDGGRMRSTVLPELRITWLVWSMGFGVQFPITHLKEFDLRTLFDLIDEYRLKPVLPRWTEQH